MVDDIYKSCSSCAVSMIVIVQHISHLFQFMSRHKTTFIAISRVVIGLRAKNKGTLHTITIVNRLNNRIQLQRFVVVVVSA